MTTELPNISSVFISDLASASQVFDLFDPSMVPVSYTNYHTDRYIDTEGNLNENIRRVKGLTETTRINSTTHDQNIIKDKEKSMSRNLRRLVQVFIVDPDLNIPVEDALLYTGKQHVTDETDQELFFSINVKELLDNHNEKRVTFKDKEASKAAGKDVFLEPARIRDLTMQVVNLLEF